MKILVTGAKGFVGRNLVESLKNIKEDKDKTRPFLVINEIYEYVIDSNELLLDTYYESCEFVYRLDGVNKPKY